MIIITMTPITINNNLKYNHNANNNTIVKENRIRIYFFEN